MWAHLQNSSSIVCKLKPAGGWSFLSVYTTEVKHSFIREFLHFPYLWNISSFILGGHPTSSRVKRRLTFNNSPMRQDSAKTSADPTRDSSSTSITAVSGKQNLPWIQRARNTCSFRRPERPEAFHRDSSGPKYHSNSYPTAPPPSCSPYRQAISEKAQTWKSCKEGQLISGLEKIVPPTVK